MTVSDPKVSQAHKETRRQQILDAALQCFVKGGFHRTGNLFGSNIFNSLAVGGAMGLVGPGDIGDDLLTGVGLALMLAIAFIALGLAARGLFVDRRDGIVLLTLYVACMAVLGFGAEDDGDDESLDPVRIEVVTDSG